MKALITGINGFTGQYLAGELAAHQYEVFGLGMQSHSPFTPNYRCADLADVDAIAEVVKEIRPDVVAHLAGIAFVGHGTPNDFYDVNLKGTRSLLAALAALDTPPVSVLLASSANVYGNAAAGMLPEESPPNPSNDYAVSKLAMEYMARLWRDRLPIFIVRPFNYTGVGQSTKFLLPKIVDHYRRKADRIELGNLDVWRDFSDVRWVVSTYRRLLEIRPAGQTINVCSGKLHSLRDVLAQVAHLSNHTLAVEVNPSFVRANEVVRLCGNPRRLQDLIGDTGPPDLDETLAWMLRAPLPNSPST